MCKKIRFCCLILLISYCVMPISASNFNNETYPIPAFVENVEFSPHGNISKMIINEIENSSSRVDIAIFIFNYKPLADALITAHNRGIQIRVLTDIRSSENMRSDNTIYNISAIEYMINNGLNVRAYDATTNNQAIMHQKIISINLNKTLLGSFNFQSAAQNYNSENMCLINSPKLYDIYNHEFEDLWNSQYIVNSTKPIKSNSKNLDLPGIIIRRPYFVLVIVALIISVIFNIITCVKLRDIKK